MSMNARRQFLSIFPALAALAVVGCAEDKPQLSRDQILMSGDGVWVGEPGAKEVHVWFDSQCPHCAALLNQSIPLIQEGLVRMKWVPVGFISQLSYEQGIVLLNSPNPEATLIEHEDKMLKNPASRGISVPGGIVDKQQRKRVESNTELLGKAKVESVPFVYFKDSKGAPSEFVGARPTELLRAIFTA